MTPDERQLISGLFDRMRQTGSADKDREAESLINQAVRQTPDAAYMLVQSVLAQEHYLQQAGARIEDLDGRVRELEDQLQSQSQKASGGSFLGGLFGGSKPQPSAQPRAASSVPSFGGGRSSPGQSGSPWGQQPQQQQGGYNQGGYGQQPMQQAPAGGGFMRSALTTAAGVAGGMMAANALQGMLGGGSANAAGHSTSSPASSSESSPFAVDSDADRQREMNAQQDAAQDQQIESEQAYLDDNSTSDDSEF